ncbi:hypothetical protein PT7_2753 [Pusillimonas sp. T7-7]|nr:hypothetical protein PT7_2753 [Pusillimonas sp. T7-7]
MLAWHGGASKKALNAALSACKPPGRRFFKLYSISRLD